MVVLGPVHQTVLREFKANASEKKNSIPSSHVCISMRMTEEGRWDVDAGRMLVWEEGCKCEEEVCLWRRVQ